jgi:hypothetical protein
MIATPLHLRSFGILSIARMSALSHWQLAWNGKESGEWGKMVEHDKKGTMESDQLDFLFAAACMMRTRKVQ